MYNVYDTGLVHVLLVTDSARPHEQYSEWIQLVAV